MISTAYQVFFLLYIIFLIFIQNAFKWSKAQHSICMAVCNMALLLSAKEDDNQSNIISSNAAIVAKQNLILCMLCRLSYIVANSFNWQKHAICFANKIDLEQLTIAVASAMNNMLPAMLP